MPFAADTRDRVMHVLGLPVVAPRWVEQVQRALDSAANYGGDEAIARIEGYLDSYDAAETGLNSDTANAGLIRADVLEWAPGSRASGYKNEMSRLRGLVLNALFIPEERTEILRNSPNFSTNRVRIR